MKPSSLTEKAYDGILPPAAAPATSESSRSFRARFTKTTILRIAIASLAAFSLHRYVERKVEAEAQTWLSNPFQHLGGYHGRPGKDHRIRNGRDAEMWFLTVPNSASAIGASRLFATKPHMAGTPGDFETAKDFLTLLQEELGAKQPDDELGAQPIYSAGTGESRNATLSIPVQTEPTAWIDVYYPVMNTPIDHSLKILNDDGSVAWNADLEEVADHTDPEAGKYAEAVLAWHGLSRGGDVSGKLVYANYGRQQDYQDLVSQGVDFTGKIVLVRYGGIFRGLKVKGAQELGAAGVLIYSDPRDDGTVTVENGYLPYPHGPARNPSSLQRGSVQYLSVYPGDPTTPGYPSYENSTRTEGVNIPAIPSLPLSWANAKVLLDEIDSGKNRTVALVNHVDDRVIPIWNTMGVIPGYIKDEVVVIGNHRDAWVMGATDPSSGTASIHEVVRGFGELLRKGWKPLRTIVIASWDAEEYGLIGSTEWGEDFADFIDKHVVAYLNLDSSVSGSQFGASASPTLAHIFRSAAERVPHPTKPGMTLWDATKDRGVLGGANIDQEVVEMYEAESLMADSVGVQPLGSGSDYTVFLQRSGVACASGAMHSTLHDPVYHYHSVFDSERWQETYGDPGFTRHVAVAQHLGLLTLGIADSVLLPLNTTHYAYELENYLTRVESIASTTSLAVDFSALKSSIKDLQAASAKLDKEKAKVEHDLKKLIHKIVKRRFIRRKIRKAICKIKKMMGKKCECPHKKMQSQSQFEDAFPAAKGIKMADGRVVTPRVGRLPAWAKEQNELAGGDHHTHKPKFPRKTFEKIIKRIRTVNKKLVAFERGLIHEDGIKDREWYRHLGVAPGKWLGYGATTLPALTESLTIEKNATLAKYEADRLDGLIRNISKRIEP